MRRQTLLALLSVFIFAGLAAGQTLADAARAQQAKKKTPSATGKVYTNESLEFHAAPAEPAAKSGEGAAAGAVDAKPADAAAAADADAANPEDKKKAADELKEKVSKQQGEITQLQRELDVLQRENRMRAAIFYSDAGSRLRDEKKFADDDRKYAADIDAKQKAIVAAQASLDKLREEARRAGIPVS